MDASELRRPATRGLPLVATCETFGWSPANLRQSPLPPVCHGSHTMYSYLMTSRRANAQAIIIGGGIAGPVTAMALQRAGIPATVYEAYDRASDGVGAF